MLRTVAGSVLLVLAIGASASGACPPTPTTHATDDSNYMLSKMARRDLSKRLNDYDLKTGHQVFVWIGATTAPEDAAFPLHDRLFRFGYRCFNAWGIGRKGVDDGVAVFFFVADDASWIATGYWAEKKISDREADRIHGQIISPRMRAKRYEEAVMAGVDAILADLERP